MAKARPHKRWVGDAIRWAGVVLAVALVVLWARSYLAVDRLDARFVSFDGPRPSTAAGAAPGDLEHAFIARTLWATSVRGILLTGLSRYESIAWEGEDLSDSYHRWSQWPRGPEFSTFASGQLKASGDSYLWRLSTLGDWWVLGFGTESGGRMGETYRAAGVPHAFPTLLCALPMLLHLRKTRRIAKRVRTGRCVHCGYDCSAGDKVLPTCPECGRASAGGTPATGEATAANGQL